MQGQKKNKIILGIMRPWNQAVLLNNTVSSYSLHILILGDATGWTYSITLHTASKTVSI